MYWPLLSLHCSPGTPKGDAGVGHASLYWSCKNKAPILAHCLTFSKSNLKYSFVWSLPVFIYWFNFLIFLVCTVQTKQLQAAGWIWPTDHDFIQDVIFSPWVCTTAWSSWGPEGYTSRACRKGGGAVREEVNSKENLAGSKRQRGKGMTDFRQSSALASAGVITLALTEGNYWWKKIWLLFKTKTGKSSNMDGIDKWRG